MSLEIPTLDDRRWEDLVAEARALIPRRAPAWTDHNVHDPGITLIELFAWLAEMQLYQLDRIGEAHREGFARLADVRRRQRTPARVLVRVETPLPVGITLPAGTQLNPVGADDLIFETDERVQLTASRLERVAVDDGVSVVDQTDANRRAETAFLAFGESASAGASLLLAFDAFYAGEPELRLTFDVFTADLGPSCEPEIEDAGALSDNEVPIPAARLSWEVRGANGWQPIAVRADTTYGLMTSGVVTLEAPRSAAKDHGLSWIRARIEQGAYDIEPRLRNVAVNVLPCSQQMTVRDERLNTGTGRPDQIHALSQAPLLVRTAPSRGVGDEDAASPEPVIVAVGGEPWTRVESFEESGPRSKHFLLHVDEPSIQFGNGLNGRIPTPADVIVAVEYHTCAGSAGNVAANQPWRFTRSEIAGVALRNLTAATGGADPETLADLELRSQANLRRPDRAVTLGDIERIAMATPNIYVARAKAIPNCPRLETITVVVLPKMRPGRTSLRTRVSDAFLGTVQRHLDRHRLLCDRLRVTAPAFIEISVSAELRLVKGAGPAAVLARAREALNLFLRGGLDLTSVGPAIPASTETPCPTRWPFGRSVLRSEVYAVLESVQGVDTVWNVVLQGRRGNLTLSQDAVGTISIPRIGLAIAGEHHLVVGDRARGRR